MDELLNAISSVVALVSPEKVKVIADKVRLIDASKASAVLPATVGTPKAALLVEQLAKAWNGTAVGSSELASMLLAASHAYAKSAAEQSSELVWTGPTTSFVSARRTEQVLLQVIGAAQSNLFITSFVAYDVSAIVKALNSASDSGVAICMLLEMSEDHGGSISFDSIGKMKSLIPAARFYVWRDKAGQFTDGRVHAKVAVADGKICFITSANLTGYAMDKNMELGVLISGGKIPNQIREHLGALVSTKTIQEV